MVASTRLPELVGIVNLTPDSFSDGGQVASAAEAVRRARQLLHDGARVVDLGAESTRPGATPLNAMEEWLRLESVLAPIIAEVHAGGGLVSLDTRHAAVAERALELGADWINDVSGLTNDAMAEVIARFPDASYVITHSLSIPADPKIVLPPDADPLEEVLLALRARLHALEARGISTDRIILDPGIGFGKTAAQSLRILHDIQRLQVLGCQLLVGHSRKSFLSHLTNAAPHQRDAGTLAASMYLAQKGVEYVRVHDVAAHRQAFDVWKGLNDAAP